jgi:hypothetical protein
MNTRDAAVSGWANARDTSISGWADSTMNTRDAAVSGWANARDTSISGWADSTFLKTAYTAGTGLTLVGTTFNTANTGNFDCITINTNAYQTSPIKIGTSAGGYSAGELAPSTYGNMIGYYAGYLSSGCNYSNFLGYRAGYLSYNSIDTVFIGHDAAYSTSGCNYSNVIGNTTAGYAYSCTYSNIIGYQSALNSNNSNYSNIIGYKAGNALGSGSYSNIFGYQAGNVSKSSYSSYIGYNAGAYASGSYNIEILTSGSAGSILGSSNNKINIESTIIGDTSSKLIAIGSVGINDLTPAATVHVKPKLSTNIGVVVQGAASHSVNLQEWQNSSSSVLASISKDGIITTAAAIKTPIITASDAATVTFNLNTGNTQTVTLGGSRTLALSNASVGQVFVVRLVQGGTGNNTVTWFSTIKWPGGLVPTLTTTLNKTDVFAFICTSSGNYDGFVIGYNL